MLIWAHRGSHETTAPLENTLESFERAIDERADGIELDVHLSRDGVPIVFHDETLTRLVTGRDDRTLNSLTAAELAEVELLGGYRIPTLRQVLAQVSGRLPINIEIKDSAAVDAVAELLSEDGENECMISSFSAAAIEYAASRLPGLERAWISGEARIGPLVGYWLEHPFDTLERCRADRWHTDRLSVNAVNVKRAAKLGIDVHVWTVNDLDEAVRLRELGVAGVFSDHPGRLRSQLD